MKLLKKIDQSVGRWLDKREKKREAKQKKPPHLLSNRRQNLYTVKQLCKQCGNTKMFYKNGIYKCTKCGTKIKL